MDETTPTVEAKAKSKVLYIVIAAIAILVLGAGFFFGSGMTQTALAPAGVDVDQNRDGSTTYTTNEGTVTVGNNASMPENWPSDAPRAYSGATIVYSGTTNPTTGETGSAVSYTAPGSVQEVIQYYLDGIKAEGWAVESDASVSGMRVIVAKKDTRTLGVYIMDGGNGTVSVTAGVQL